jgi:cell division protein FtsL
VDPSQFVQTFGVPVALLLAIILAGAKGIWVYGRTHKEIVDGCHKQLENMTLERDEWRAAALRSTALAGDAVATVETVATSKRKGLFDV